MHRPGDIFSSCVLTRGVFHYVHVGSTIMCLEAPLALLYWLTKGLILYCSAKEILLTSFIDQINTSVGHFFICCFVYHDDTSSSLKWPPPQKKNNNCILYLNIFFVHRGLSFRAAEFNNLLSFSPFHPTNINCCVCAKASLNAAMLGKPVAQQKRGTLLLREWWHSHSNSTAALCSCEMDILGEKV